MAEDPPLTSASEGVTTVVHCWSAPRSRSTALLYSFDARSDVVALDEPLYREWWLQQDSDLVTRPYAQHLVDGGASLPDSDKEQQKWQRVTLSLEERIRLAMERLPPNGIVFCKHMAKHWSCIRMSRHSKQQQFVSSPTVRHVHVLLIRDPVAVLMSWKSSADVHGNNPTADEVGILPLLQIYAATSSNVDTNHNVVVLDSDALSQRPAETLSQLCRDLDIVDHSADMLQWAAGPKDCDGPWAPWWYDTVHTTTGWTHTATTAAEKRYRTLDPALHPALHLSLPAYECLYRLTHSHRQRGPPPETLFPTIMSREDETGVLLERASNNANVLVWIGTPTRGRLVPRECAGVSPWDSAVQGGDATWEGIRVYRGRILHLDAHLQRLQQSAQALGFDMHHTHSKDQITDAIFQTLAANHMRDGAHMRLTLTRGEKYTSSMNPLFNVYGTTLLILPEWKPVEGATTYDNSKGVSLITASQRRNSPSTLDSKIHHNNLLNNILPKLQANQAGAADAIMLDVDGFVSETNATNLFMVDADGVLLTPHAHACLPGITRASVLRLAQELSIPHEVRNISLTEFHSAREVFTSGTMGELTPVTNIDGRTIGWGTDHAGKRGPITTRLQDAYRLLPDRPDCSTPLPPFS